MAWRPHSHARVSSTSPEAWAKCDRCGSVFNLSDLQYQYDWAGAKLINKRVKVCASCLDEPQEQLRTYRFGPDPVPVRDPRPLNNQAVTGGYAVMVRSVKDTADLGFDFGSDLSQRVPAFTLNVVPSGNDVTQGYPGSPFSDEADELVDIPISIDPPS